MKGIEPRRTKTVRLFVSVDLNSRSDAPKATTAEGHNGRRAQRRKTTTAEDHNSNYLPRHRTAEHGFSLSAHMHNHLLHGAITDRIIHVFHDVYSELGAGHLESVYANAMAIAMRDAGVHFEREVRIVVYFRGQSIGLFKADALVESVVMLEYKAGRHLDPAWEDQLLNHLRNTRVELGLMLYFGRRPVVKRRILTNDQKLLPPSEMTGR